MHRLHRYIHTVRIRVYIYSYGSSSSRAIAVAAVQCARSFLINDEFLKDDGNTIQVHVAVWMCSSHFVFDGLLAFPSLLLLLLSVEFEFLFQFFVSKGEGGVVGLVFFCQFIYDFE